MSTIIWHNPRCSKSRQTLTLIEEKGIAPQIVKYLETPPSAQDIDEVLTALGKEPRDLMRKKEAEYKELGLDDPTLSRTQLIEAMVQNPKLIERPVVLHSGKAALGRPPEDVLKIL